jgi:hypothetical protein
MSKIALSGNASGTGTFTIASPNSNSDRTLNLPDNSGTVLTSATDDPALVFKRSNILGTVSQSGGVPTGAIIEQGSNANGSFTRYADGTLLCNHIHSIGSAAVSAGAYYPASGTAGFAWTLPSSSVSGAVSLSGSSGEVANNKSFCTVVYARNDPSGAIGYRLYFFSAKDVGWNSSIQLNFVGRWF